MSPIAREVLKDSLDYHRRNVAGVERHISDTEQSLAETKARLADTKERIRMLEADLAKTAETTP